MMVNLTIDGKSVAVEAGTTILKAAETVGVKIPTLCWLEKVSANGSCRICVVEIAGVERPMTACNTPVKNGIVVTTQSEKLKKLRQQTLNLIMLNHPLLCPFCDASGECELQNLCFDLDVVHQPFSAPNAKLTPGTNWPLVMHDPSRCVLCKKCVKVCHELVGADALSINEKGDRAHIEKNLVRCTSCGNCVSVCPTGAMISKPFRFKARPWTLTRVPSICTFCSSLCPVEFNVKDNRILRVTSNDDEINRGLLCISGFFSHDYVAREERLTRPLLNGVESNWNEVLARIAAEIEMIRHESGASAIAGLSSPHLTNEENYLFQKLFRAGIGSNNIDSEARFGAMRSLRSFQAGIGLAGASHKIDAIAEADTILVFGADPAAEAPLIDWKIQETVRQHDGRLVVANMRRIHLSQFANCQLTYKPGSEVPLIMGLSRLLVDRGHLNKAELERTVVNLDVLESDLAGVDLEQVVMQTGLSLSTLCAAADLIGTARKLVMVFGSDIKKSEYGIQKSTALANLAIITCTLSGGAVFPLADKGNMQGILDMGVYPEGLPGYQSYARAREKFSAAWGVMLPDGGLNAEEILHAIEAGDVRMLYLVATNPQTFAGGDRWIRALAKVEFLIVQDIFPSALTELADVVLPGCTSTEKNGSLTTLDGTLTWVRKAVQTPGDCREEGEIFTELLSRLNGRKYTFDNQNILQEIRALSGLFPEHGTCKAFAVAPQSMRYQPVDLQDNSSGLQLLCGHAQAHFGTTSSWSPALQEIEAESVIQLSMVDACRTGVTDGDYIRLSSALGSAVGPVQISPLLPEGLVFAPSCFVELAVTNLLPVGCNMVPVGINKA